MILSVLVMLLMLVFAVISLALYFIPTYVAKKRKARHGLAIGLVNLLLGWTFLGWVGSLVWAVTDSTNA